MSDLEIAAGEVRYHDVLLSETGKPIGKVSDQPRVVGEYVVLSIIDHKPIGPARSNRRWRPGITEITRRLDEMVRVDRTLQKEID